MPNGFGCGSGSDYPASFVVGSGLVMMGFDCLTCGRREIGTNLKTLTWTSGESPGVCGPEKGSWIPSSAGAWT
jgi:hypothetical protein